MTWCNNFHHGAIPTRRSKCTFVPVKFPLPWTLQETVQVVRKSRLSFIKCSQHHLHFSLKDMAFYVLSNAGQLEGSGIFSWGILGLALSICLSEWRLWVALAHASKESHWLCFPKMIDFILLTWGGTVNTSEGTSNYRADWFLRMSNHSCMFGAITNVRVRVGND